MCKSPPKGKESQSTTDQLIDIIKMLSQTQQEYLLKSIITLVNDDREFQRKDCQIDVTYPILSSLPRDPS